MPTDFFIYKGDDILKIKKICNGCGYHEDKCRCNKTNKIQAKKKPRDVDKMLFTSKWQKKRKQIKDRDGWFCQRCWYKFKILNRERLEVHHIKNRIDYPELMFEDSNLITICKTCNLQLGSAHELDFEFNIEERDEEAKNFIL